MRTATTAIVAAKPTVSECARGDRQAIITLSAAGWTAPAMAAHLERRVRTVTRWRSAYRRQGEAGLAYHSRRPHTAPPHTTSPLVVVRIGARRPAHPGWGARLIRNQLLLEGFTPLPCERTVQRWLRRLGFGTVRAPTPKPLGFPQPPAVRDDTLWEIDHTQKRGPFT
jgi:transposase